MYRVEVHCKHNFLALFKGLADVLAELVAHYNGWHCELSLLAVRNWNEVVSLAVSGVLRHDRQLVSSLRQTSRTPKACEDFFEKLQVPLSTSNASFLSEEGICSMNSHPSLLGDIFTSKVFMAR